MQNICKTCKYWVPIEKEMWGTLGIELGECHYNPPHPAWFKRTHLQDITDQYVVWPLTATNSFCSKYYDKNTKIGKKFLFF